MKTKLATIHDAVLDCEDHIGQWSQDDPADEIHITLSGQYTGLMPDRKGYPVQFWEDWTGCIVNENRLLKKRLSCTQRDLKARESDLKTCEVELERAHKQLRELGRRLWSAERTGKNYSEAITNHWRTVAERDEMLRRNARLERQVQFLLNKIGKYEPRFRLIQ